MYLRVNGVQYDVYHVGYEVDVGLASAAAALLAERCVVGKAPEEQLEVVHAQHVGRVANAGGLEQVAVVSGERVGEERLAHVRSPDGQYAVELGVWCWRSAAWRSPTRRGTCATNGWRSCGSRCARG